MAIPNTLPNPFVTAPRCFVTNPTSIPANACTMIGIQTCQVNPAKSPPCWSLILSLLLPFRVVVLLLLSTLLQLKDFDDIHVIILTLDSVHEEERMVVLDNDDNDGSLLSLFGSFLFDDDDEGTIATEEDNLLVMILKIKNPDEKIASSTLNRCGFRS